MTIPRISQDTGPLASDTEADELEGVDVEFALDLSDELDAEEEHASDLDGDTERSPLEAALTSAAQIAAKDDATLDQFMKSAWKAYLHVRPDVQEQIEHMALVKHLRMLRRAGKLGLA